MIKPKRAGSYHSGTCHLAPTWVCTSRLSPSLRLHTDLPLSGTLCGQLHAFDRIFQCRDSLHGCIARTLLSFLLGAARIRLGFVHAGRDHYPALGSPSEVWLVKLCGWRSVSRKPWCSADTIFLSFSSGPAGASLEYTKSGRSPMLGVSSLQSSIFHGCCRLGHP